VFDADRIALHCDRSRSLVDPWTSATRHCLLVNAEVRSFPNGLGRVWLCLVTESDGRDLSQFGRLPDRLA
jgi:hypothetical protein